MMGRLECIDDDDFFRGNLKRTMTARVISEKCTVFSATKEIMQRILQMNPDIKKYITSRWESKRDFL
jgi:ActR/RegA family two-component response regulator